MERTRFTPEDVGKRVVNARDEEIGVVVRVNDGTARVDPDPGRRGTSNEQLDWGLDEHPRAYLLELDRVRTVTTEEVRLQK